MGYLPRFMNTPIEAAELRHPVRIERYEFSPDSGGAGTTRGSLALRRDIRLLAERASFARYSDRHKFAPQGLFGGKPGRTGALILNPGTAGERRLKSNGLDTLVRGDLVFMELPGAGGYGDPRKRAFEAIGRDLKDGKVTPEGAERDYDVVVDRRRLAIDRAATERLRAQRT